MEDILKIIFWNNTVKDYLVFAAVLVGSMIILLIIKKIIVVRLKKKAATTATTIDDSMVKMLNRFILPLMFFGAIYFSSNLLVFTDSVSNIIRIVTFALIILFGAMALSNLLILLFTGYLEKKNRATNVTSMKWISVLIKIIVWICALLLFLDNLNIEITALLAGLGVGGIAIAFALNSILQDLFSFVTIFFDRPFEIGDFINVGDMSGTIEHIGIKTTRVRSLSGEQLVFSNNDLTNSRIRNYKHMKNRRIAFSVGVTYDTPSIKLRQIPDMIKKIINDLENTKYDRVHLKSFDDSSITFEIVYYVLSQDYTMFMDVQQDINFGIKDVFDKNAIEFAFPTQTIYIQKQ
ncbi:MAG: mechanosensitive ion channel family protein [Clostridiales bacterium]|nr:mechanosensitive ion channel family protein [Clostridiales bacterium]